LRTSQVIPTKDSTLLELLYADTELDEQSTIVPSHQEIDGMFIQSKGEKLKMNLF